MSGTIRFHLDENVSIAVANALRRCGSDVTTTPEEGLIAASDEVQLEFALSRVVLLNFSVSLCGQFE